MDCDYFMVRAKIKQVILVERNQVKITQKMKS